ncbi:MAG: hypothetical protein CMF12_13675 [Idiomarina sp.]|uniref:hypothetical protein n=1 Tax=Idiomarina sp. TaxID=1874361 RepID=UPI000C4F4D87|nr:hypothetical protein [Idiomarina sp.]MBT43555.1 hypothetical protein [Idiomarina sp.]|tara:strand:+ start:415 stop:663 length:249 start_codon:yes stop_codon:yes gene_type:complete
MLNRQRVESWLTKQQKALVESVEEDSEVVEVLLKKGYVSASEQETVWVFGKDTYERGNMTLKAIKSDLKTWFDDVEPVEEEA